MKRFGYLATTDLASEEHGTHFTKWRQDDIKMATRGIKVAMASTFVEQFPFMGSMDAPHCVL